MHPVAPGWPARTSNNKMQSTPAFPARRLAHLLAAAGALALAACGGGDGGTATPAPDATSSVVIRTFAEPAGANCATGGTRADAGRDANGNGALDAGEEATTVYMCTQPGGAAGLIRTAVEPAGANCASGGTRIQAGLDDDGNGALVDAEVDTTTYVCNAAPPAGGLVRTIAEPPGVNCALGGWRVQAGVDDNGNGVLESTEVDSTAYACTAPPPGAYTWHTAQRVNTMSSFAGSPRIAMAPDGNGMMAWGQLDGAYLAAYAARFDATSLTWQAPVVLHAAFAGHASGIQVAMDPNGNAIVTWAEQDAGGRYDIRARRYVAASNTWTPSTLLETDNADAALAPVIGMDSAGNAIVAWHQTDGTGIRSIWVNRFDAASGAWQGAVEVDGSTTRTEEPRVAVEPDGDAVLLWLRENGSHTDLMSSRYAVATGTWGAPIPVENLGGDAAAPVVAINASGKAVVGWRHFEESGPINYYATVSDAAGTWNLPTPLETDAVINSTSFDVAIDNTGNATVLWYRTGTLHTWRYTPAGNSWSEIATDPIFTLMGDIAMDDAGNIHGIWRVADDFIARRLPAGATAWDGPVLLETDTGNLGTASAIAVTPDGKGIAAWQQRDSLNVDHVFANTLR